MKRDVKVCPRCNSTDVAVQGGNPLTDIGGVTPNWGCQHCGYTGTMASMDAEEADELEVKDGETGGDPE